MRRLDFADGQVPESGEPQSEEIGMVKRKAIERDVARPAGVSRSAVSLLLNGRANGKVTAERQERVLRAAAELDYTPMQHT
jgi:hypothetical protein